MSAVHKDFGRLVKRAMGEHPMSPVGAPKWNTTVANSAPSAATKPIDSNIGAGAWPWSKAPSSTTSALGAAAGSLFKNKTPGVDFGYQARQNPALGDAVRKGMTSGPAGALGGVAYDVMQGIGAGADRMGEGWANTTDALNNPNNEGGRTTGGNAWNAAKGLAQTGAGAVQSGLGLLGMSPESQLMSGLVHSGESVLGKGTDRPATTVASPAERGVVAKATEAPATDGSNWGGILPALAQIFAMMAGGMGGGGQQQQPGGSPGDYLSQFAGNVNPAMQVAMSNPYVPRT